MKGFLYFNLLGLMSLVACAGIPALGSQATPTLIPTHTPEPTFTPSPSDTPTPTETPNVAATAAAEATLEARDVLAELDEQLGDTDIPYKNGRLAWQQITPLTADLAGPDGRLLEIDDALTLDNFILKSDVTWHASGPISCGAIFRSEPNIRKGKQYIFFFIRLPDQLPWVINVHEFGEYKDTITDVRYSSAFDLSDDATNQFVLVAQEERFTIYFNHILQGTFSDHSKQRSRGYFAFLCAQESGKGKCEFENSWIWALN